MKNKLMHSIFSLIVFFSCCTNRDTVVDKSKLLGYDYRLFQGTPAWELAKAVQDADVDQIRTIVQHDKGLLEYTEPRFGQALLQTAVMNRNYNSVKVLLELGADPNKQDSYLGNSALMESLSIDAGGGGPHPDADTSYLKILLKYGGDPNAVQDGDSTKVAQNHSTVLGIACLSGVLEYIKILVKAGANINLANSYGYSTLNWAITSGNPDMVLYLLKMGADFSKPMLTNEQGHKIYILEDMDISWEVFNSPEFLKKKAEIEKFIGGHK